MAQPDWWKSKEAKDKHGVVAHTPDPTKYHNTDQIGFEKASHATMIPRARGLMGDGSRGFNHNMPSAKIVVDPGMEGGGFEIDPSKLSSVMVRKAIEQEGGIDTGEDSRENIFHVLQSLSKTANPATAMESKTAEAPAPVERVNPAYPNSYVVPKANANGRQVVGVSRTPVLELPKDLPPPVLGPVAEAPTIPVEENNMSQMGQMMQMFEQVLKRMDAMSTVPIAPTPPTVAELPPVRVAHRPAEVPENPPVRLVSATKIGCLDAPTVQRPSRNVVFSWTDGGVMSCRYHEVVIGDGCIVLVYDTRYEDGMQWIPPVLNERATMKISLREESGKREFEVASLGISFTLGCLDVIIMTLIEETTPVKQVNPRFAQLTQQEE